VIAEVILEEEAIGEERAADGAWPGVGFLDRPIRSLPDLQSPIGLSGDATVRRAIDTMNGLRVGCILVVERDLLVGVFTERDVLTRVAGGGVDTDTTLLGELMTPDPEWLTLDDSIAFALNKMSVGGFRHVPLIDAEGRPTGAVSMRHIVDFIVDLFPREVLNLPPTPALGMPRTREGA
jgi:CBS domain-containing protein